MKLNRKTFNNRSNLICEQEAHFYYSIVIIVDVVICFKLSMSLTCEIQLFLGPF